MTAPGDGRVDGGSGSRSPKPATPSRIPLRPVSAPVPGSIPAVCPHCWMVNPGPFRLCGRCGADMTTHLQESGGLRRTAPVQSPVPQGGTRGRSVVQRIVLGVFVAVLTAAYVAQFFAPSLTESAAQTRVPAEESF